MLLTAFVTDFGLFEWVRMPFRLKCASNSFIRALQLLLFPLRDFCDSYVDDIVTFTSGRTKDRQDSWPLHLEQVRAFLLTMRKAGTRKVKPIWILLEQETVSGSGISWAICKSTHRSRK